MALSFSSCQIPGLTYMRKKSYEVKKQEEFGPKMFFPLELSSTQKLKHYAQDLIIEKAGSPLHGGGWDGILLQTQLSS